MTTTKRREAVPVEPRPQLRAKPDDGERLLQRDIVTTVFGQRGDEGHARMPSAYGGFVDPNHPQCALPYRFKDGKRHWVLARNPATGESVVMLVNDVGPWTSVVGLDAYWNRPGARPKAEGDHRTNKAGIDITPAAAKKLGIKGKGKLDWGFCDADGKLI